jgi:hypothetical protein
MGYKCGPFETRMPQSAVRALDTARAINEL